MFQRAGCQKIEVVLITKRADSRSIDQNRFAIGRRFSSVRRKLLSSPTNC